MKRRLALLAAVIALLLSGCGYHIVEEAPVQVGSSIASTSSVFR